VPPPSSSPDAAQPPRIVYNIPNRPAITVAEFFRAGEQSLELNWETDPALAENRIIRETALNRPGLALAGHLQHFANKRIQVFGLAETAYLRTIPVEERRRLFELFAPVPAVALARSRRLPPYARRVAERLRVPVMRTRLVTGAFMNAATVLLANLASPRLRVPGTMVEVNGVGVLLEGEPGIGKSEIALALIKRGHSLVSDDTTVLTRDSTGAINGEAVPITANYMEIRGLGLIHVPRLFGIASTRARMKLDLIIRMQRPHLGEYIDRTGLDTNTRNVLDVGIPLITVPVAAGRDLTNVVEVAALNQRLKQMGYDSVRDLDDHLVATLSKKTKP